MKSSHATANDAKHAAPTTYYQFLEVSVRELLIEKGVLSAEDIRNAVKEMDSRGPELGAQVVAHAWVDPQFKQSLLQDAPSAVKDTWTRHRPCATAGGGEHARSPQFNRLYTLLVLSAHVTRTPSGLVQKS